MKKVNNNYRIKYCFSIALLVFCVSVFLTACGKKRVIDETNLPSVTEVVSVSGLSVSESSVSTNDEVSADSVNDDLLDEVQRENLTNQFQYINTAYPVSKPSAMNGLITEGYGRDIFFANGTPIIILEPNADMEGYVHDEQLQADLGNGLGPDNRGYGGIATWQENSEKKYVVLSNMAEVFGGSYKNNLRANIDITLDGSESKSAYPNISFLFGGSMGGDVIGNINIKVSDALPMYVYGGCYNGGVYGDVDINYDGEGWSMTIVGGSLSMSAGGNVHSCVYGNIKLNLLSSSSSKFDSIIGGGLALTDTDYLAVSDVHGDVNMTVSGESVYEICGGGMACKLNKDSGYAMSNIYGNTEVCVDNASILVNEKNSPKMSGIICGGCMANGSVGMVSGNTKVTLGKVKFANRTMGVFSGGITNRKLGTSRANVYGECTYGVTDDKYKYDFIENKGGIKSTNSLNNYFCELFSGAELEYSEELKDEFVGQDMEDVVNLPNIPMINSIYENQIFSYMSMAEFSKVVMSEKASNMKDVADFQNDKKSSFEIYYPNPTSGYIWTGNL